MWGDSQRVDLAFVHRKRRLLHFTASTQKDQSQWDLVEEIYIVHNMQICGSILVKAEPFTNEMHYLA
jgi:hypothetical protein